MCSQSPQRFTTFIRWLLDRPIVLTIISYPRTGRKKKRRKKKKIDLSFLSWMKVAFMSLFLFHILMLEGEEKRWCQRGGELQPCLKEHYQKGMHAQCYYQTFMLKDEKRDDRICQSFLLLHAVILITWWDSCKLLHFWCHCCFLLPSGNDVLGPAKGQQFEDKSLHLPPGRTTHDEKERMNSSFFSSGA